MFKFQTCQWRATTNRIAHNTVRQDTLCQERRVSRVQVAQKIVKFPQIQLIDREPQSSMFEQTDQEIASENEPDVSMMKMLLRIVKREHVEDATEMMQRSRRRS